MAIGTSRGAYFDDEFHHAAGINTDPSMDNNVQDPDIDPARQTSDQNIQKPQDFTFTKGLVNASDIVVNKHVTITDKDIDKAMDLGMSFSGGGLSTVEAEAVKSAALRYKGEVTEGVNHGTALDKIMKAHSDDIHWGDIEDGFTTTHGRFLTREDAFKLANERRQIDPELAKGVPEDQHPMLLSEDLQHVYNHDAHVEYMENPVQQQQAKAGDVTQFRKAANENLPIDHPDRPYNDRDPSMLGSREQDAAIESSWKKMVDRSAKIDAVNKQIDDLMKVYPHSEFDKARLAKLRQDRLDIWK